MSKSDRYIPRDNNRNERIYPSRTNSRYFVIVQMRKRIEGIIENYIKDIHSNSTLVDFGCGIKPYYNLFIPFVSKYLGADIEGNANADITLNQDKSIPIDSDSVELVLSNQVLEHVDSPDLYLQECYRILKKDSLMIISTHGHWVYHPDPNDYWRWTSSGLKKLITAQGFTITECIGVMGLSATSIHLFQDSIYNKVPVILRKPFVFMMQFIISIMDKIQKQPEKNLESAVYFIVAKK